MIRILLVVLAAAMAPLTAAAEPDPVDWAAVEAEARGQTVYWHAWGGDPRINAYVAWAADEIEARHGVRVEHVKLADTGEAVARVLAERSAGRDVDGAVDLVWINGENFAALRAAELLFGPWAEDLPYSRLTNAADRPALARDFTLPVDGFEAPWGLAQLVFYHDAARTPEPPRTLAALLDWAAANPGRFAYPAPPDFLGAAFLKQALHDLTADPAVLQAPVEAADYAAATAPLWAYLDALRPHLWRGGRTYPRSQAQVRQLIADGETELAFSYNPAEAGAAVAAGEVPATARSYVLDGGTLANAHFLAIPYNAAAKAGAMVAANFLTSPEAQARKQDPAVWGDATVLDLERLEVADRDRFTRLEAGPAAPPAQAAALPEPHPSWTARLEADWQRRYGVTQ